MKIIDSLNIIDSRAAVSVLDQVAENKRHYVYLEENEFCRNFDSRTKEPSCIVGHVLAKLGLTPEQCGQSTVVSTLSELEAKSDTRFTVAAAAALAAAQGVQDTGGTWGEAVNAAHRVVQTLRYFDPIIDAGMASTDN